MSLRCFLPECGSFTKASEKLFISSTSVMKQINSLESHLDLKLVERTNQGVRLTEVEKVIYKHAKYLFKYSEKAIIEARQKIESAKTIFCVGTSILNPCNPFMDLWYKINKEFPHYKLHLVPFEDDHEGILSEIGALGEKFDFLVAACDSEQWFSLCNFLPLGTYHHCLAVFREHRLAESPEVPKSTFRDCKRSPRSRARPDFGSSPLQKERLTIEDLYGETLMLVKRGDSRSVDCIRNKIEKHPQIQIEDIPQFYDMEVFNRCARTENVMLILDCWKDVHPALVN